MPLILPNEILQQIFSYLQVSLRNKGHGHAFDNVGAAQLEEEAARQLTLSNISIASKQFRKLALPFLYTTTPTTSVKLLGNLAKSADLARLVKAIDLSHTGMPMSSLRETFDAVKSRFALPATFEAHLGQAIDRVGDDLNNTGAEAVLHLLLLQNLDTLEYRGYIGSNRIITEFFSGLPMELDGREVVQISQLSELRLRHWSGENTTRITQVQQLLRDSVEKLQACGINWEIHPDSGQGRPTCIASRLRLKNIEIVDSTINGTGLDDLLGRCPELATLRIVWGSSSRMPTFPLDFGVMGDAIRRHAKRLHTLALDCTEDLSYTQGNSGGRVGSLRELTRLKTLVIAQDMLVGDEDGEGTFRLDQVLPDSLETMRLLTCQENEEDLDEQLTGLIQEGSMPKLRRLQLKRDEEFTGDAAELGWSVWHRWDKMVLTKK
ncbi:hypothetical protein SCUP234_12201 [Seiridium cupressi]